MIASAASISEPRLSQCLDAGVCCAHCGLPVPAGLFRAGEQAQFCCHGCEGAYRLIRQCGLDRYYLLRDSAAAQPNPARSTGRKYAEFDDAAFHRLFVRPTAQGTFIVDLFVEGIHCGACVWLLEKLPRIAPGVVESQLNLRRSLLRIEWDASITSLSSIARAVESLGYLPHAAREVAMRESRTREDRRQLVRLALAAACAGNVMLLAAALYAGLLDSMEPQFISLFRWTSLGLTAVSVLGPGAVFFRGALTAIRARTLHLDVPIALGLGAGLAWGVVNTLTARGEVYFDSLSVLVFALLLGRWVQRRQQRSSSDSLELLYSLTPSRARLVQPNGDAVEVRVESLQPDQIVEVRAGESIPVDGEIVNGSTRIDQSLLTGEPVPIPAHAGCMVTAGAVNVSAAIQVRVHATGEATRLGKLARLVEEASQRRAPIVRMADRLAGWFLLAMLVLATLTAAIWLWLDPSQALDNAVALLIVTCPCALGLATPLAMTAAIGKAARRGMLIKGGDALERLSHTGTLLLDKTGTITRGRLELVQWLGDDSIKPMVAALEAQSSHPIAQALVRDLGPSSLEVSGVVQVTGAGISGIVQSQFICVGSPVHVMSRSTAVQPIWNERLQRICDAGQTPILVSVNEVIVAAIGLGDAIREGSQQAVDSLRSKGWKVGVLSGDNAEVVTRIGRQLNIPSSQCRGGATPEEKLAAVKDAMRLGPVVMVGDGVNDAAALAGATVGIAVHGGAEASMSAADVYLNQPGLSGVVELIDGASRTMRVVRRNLFISILYNAVAAALAVTGIIHPLMAAILMPMSSLTVVALSYRSRTFGADS